MLVFVFNLNKGVWSRLTPEKEFRQQQMLLGSFGLLAVLNKGLGDEFNPCIDVQLNGLCGQFLT